MRWRACCGSPTAPDEVHRNQIARLELGKYQGPASLTGGSAEILPAGSSPGLCQRPVWIS
jgi:hypothetical protein